jgi:predicted ester cyclase
MIRVPFAYECAIGAGAGSAPIYGAKLPRGRGCEQAFERLVDPAVTNHQPDSEPETGLDSFRRAIEGVMAAVPDSHWETLRLLSDEDFVICHNRWSGTYEGAVFRGIAGPQGKRFSVEHVHIYRIADERIAEHWVVRDDLGMLLQTGAIAASA